jgi:hypothetical protein
MTAVEIKSDVVQNTSRGEGVDVGTRGIRHGMDGSNSPLYYPDISCRATDYALGAINALTIHGLYEEREISILLSKKIYQ